MKLPRDVPVTAGRPFIELAPETSTAILRTVEAGWALALKSPDVNAGAAEVPMTERLRDGMRSALNGGGLPWGRTMVVLPGTESRSRPDVLRTAEPTSPFCSSGYSFDSANTIPMRSSNASASPAVTPTCAGSTS